MENVSPQTNRIKSSMVLRLGLLFLILLMAVGVTAQEKPPGSGSSWDRYKPATISEIKASLVFDYPHKFVGFTINANAGANPYRVKATYLGDLRPILPNRRQLISFWSPDYFARLFEREILVEAEGERIWMPVQSPLIPDFQKELERGDRVELFIMAVGTIDNEDRHEWVFIINQFAGGLEQQALQAYDRGDFNIFDTAFAQWTKAAAKGIARARYSLGSTYDTDPDCASTETAKRVKKEIEETRNRSRHGECDHGWLKAARESG
jgi:hypothetical protein